MAEQNSQPLKDFENFNQNSTGLHPGKIDEADQNYNGILSYGEQAEKEDLDVAKGLKPEKQISETSRLTNMTTSSSRDTGFGSASVSEISSPEENSDLTDKSLQETAASLIEKEEDDSTFDNTISEDVDNIFENKERYKNVSEAEDEQNEDLAEYLTEYQIVENAGQKETFVDHIEEAITSGEKQAEATENDVNDKEELVVTEHAALDDNVVEEAGSHKEDEDSETVVDQEQKIDASVRKHGDNKHVSDVEDKSSEKTEAEMEIVDENVQIKNLIESGKRAENDDDKDTLIEKTYETINNKSLENSFNATLGGMFENEQKKIGNESLTSQTNQPTVDENLEEETENEHVTPSTNELNKETENNVEDAAFSKVVDESSDTLTNKQAVNDSEENTSTKNEPFKEVENAEEASGTEPGKDSKEAADDKKEDNLVMDILGNGLLMKKVLTPGKGADTRPNGGDIVTVRVDGLLPDGTHVDTGEITFTLNDGDVILALELAVALMEEGETCELFTSERYAYGSLGREPDVPKDTSITYTLELLGIQKPPDVSQISFDQRLKMGEAKRERGNYLFSRTDYSGAINSYNKAVKLLDNPELYEGIEESSKAVLTESWVKCYNNLAACQLKIDALDAAIKSCEKVLSAQEDNIKALFRLGKAYGAKGDVDQAITYVRHAVRLDPESKLMQQEMLNLTRRKKKETATEKALYQRMLGVRPGDKSSQANEDRGSNNSNKLTKWTLVAGGLAAVLISVGLTWYRAS